MSTDFAKLIKDLRSPQAKQFASRVASQLAAAYTSAQKTEVVVESPIELTPEQKATLQQAFIAKFPNHTSVKYLIRPNLITGIRVIFADIAYDYSAATTLTKLITAA